MIKLKSDLLLQLSACGDNASTDRKLSRSGSSFIPVIVCVCFWPEKDGFIGNVSHVFYCLIKISDLFSVCAFVWLDLVLERWRQLSFRFVLKFMEKTTKTKTNATLILINCIPDYYFGQWRSESVCL